MVRLRTMNAGTPMKLRENQISVAHGATDRNPVDSQNRSPLKHNRAGLYEKGDYNQ